MKKSHYQLEQDPFGTHQRIIKMITPNQKVLDIGCASGYLGKKLVKKNCQVIGIEIEPQEAKKAAQYYQQVIVGDLENEATTNQLKGTKFDLIILADLLEHLKEPERALKKLAQFLNKNGEVIISVPNIAFLTNRLLHLLGRFEYTPWGIMDQTHLRFFTKKSIFALVDYSGLKFAKFDYVANFTQLPLYMQTLYPILGKRKWWRKLEYNITGLWPEGLAVQFLLRCRKK